MFVVGEATQKGDKIDDVYAAVLGIGVIIIIVGVYEIPKETWWKRKIKIIAAVLDMYSDYKIQ